VTRGYQYKSSAKILRKVVQSFASLVKSGRVEMASDSAVLCRQYHELCGVPFHPYPHPRTIPINPVPWSNQAQTRSLVFSALGPPRIEKGSDLVLEAISLVRQRRPDLNIRFVLQWTDRLLRPTGEEILPTEAVTADPEVELLKSNLTSTQYLERLQRTDVMLVPYRQEQYHARLSGVAIEAFQAGVPCICISNTWIAETMANLGSGIAIDNENAESLAQAIISLASNYPEYKQRALDRAPAARSTHAPEAFVCQLMKGSKVERLAPVENSSINIGETKGSANASPTEEFYRGTQLL
jgi:glycosyltransferase involved in cell wall biosynthesis